VHGRGTVVVLSEEEYSRLTRARSGQQLVNLLGASPLRDIEIEHPSVRGPVRCRSVTGYLLDTNVISELKRARPDDRVAAFIAGEPLDRLYLSVVTFAEIRFGIELLADAWRRSDLNNWLDNKLRPMFDGRELPITEDILLGWRLIIEKGRQRGYTFSHPDVLIAASAAHHGLTVVTRNVRDFAEAGVAVIDPWAGPRTKS
jgi:predicted nucleic acid-binding protein